MFGIDIGGSGIKGARVDLGTGDLVTDRYRIPTPRPATPQAVMDVAATMVRDDGWDGPVGCAIPAVVRSGVAHTAANIDQSWIGTDGAALLGGLIRRPVELLNDADAAGLAEMRYGVGSGRSGVVILLTFGTGIGSAVFIDGRLVPNTELGHIEFRGMVAEHYAASRLVEDEGLPMDVWARRVDEYLDHIERVFAPELIVFGGGISKRFGKFEEYLSTAAELVPAKLRNNAGIVGAALAAREALGSGRDENDD